mmetsp:Transcript_22529/g.63557  ORF Transcript_22529/g.63557 Transcript_22529/m.63557 type:complete len:203 (-) Transcript_22529:665-1273(-)
MERGRYQARARRQRATRADGYTIKSAYTMGALEGANTSAGRRPHRPHALGGALGRGVGRVQVRRGHAQRIDDVDLPFRGQRGTLQNETERPRRRVAARSDRQRSCGRMGPLRAALRDEYQTAHRTNGATQARRRVDWHPHSCLAVPPGARAQRLFCREGAQPSRKKCSSLEREHARRPAGLELAKGHHVLSARYRQLRVKNR